MSLVARKDWSKSVSALWTGPLVLILASAWIVVEPARGDSVNSPNITMNADTNRTTGNGAGNVSVTISTITVAETTLPEYSSGSGKAITLKVKPGIGFDPASNITAQSASIGINGGAVNAVAAVVPTGADNEVITFNLTSGTNVQVQDIIRINGVKIRITSAAGAAGPAQTTMLLTTSAAGGAFTNQGVVAASIQKGAPDHLAFSTQPGSTQSAGHLLPAVSLVDFGGNIIQNDARTISLAIQSNPGSATLNGTKTHDTVNGVATWVDADNLNIITAATGYTLRATHSGNGFLTSDTADSGSFDITAGAPNHMVISTQPVNMAAGDNILIAVSVFDVSNNLVTATPVNVTLDAAVNPGGWPLLVASSLTKPTANGVASWVAADALRITKAVTGYRLAASGAGATVFSDLFDVTPGAASTLQFVQQPTNTAQNATMSPPVTVQVTDSFSNVTNSAVDIQLALATAPCGGTLTGGSTTSAAGLATFDSVKIDTACDGDQLSASSDGLVGAASDNFNVTSVAAATTNTCGACGAGATGAMVPLLLIQIGLCQRRLFRRRG